MGVNCVVCGKILKGKVKKLRLCSDCKQPMCRRCSINGQCKNCHSEETSIHIKNYLEDKYEQKGEQAW